MTLPVDDVSWGDSGDECEGVWGCHMVVRVGCVGWVRVCGGVWGWARVSYGSKGRVGEGVWGWVRVCGGG